MNNVMNRVNGQRNGYGHQNMPAPGAASNPAASINAAVGGNIGPVGGDVSARMTGILVLAILAVVVFTHVKLS